MVDKGEPYTRITRLLSDGQIREGAEALANETASLPRPVLLECVGNLHFYKREFPEALSKYEEAMNSDVEYDVARYHYLIGVQHERQGDYVEAFKRYQAAIEIEPIFIDSYVELGGLLVKVGDYEGALTCYTDALKLDRTDLRNFSNRVHVLQLLCSRDSAQYSDEYLAALSDLEIARERLPRVGESASW